MLKLPKKVKGLTSREKKQSHAMGRFCEQGGQQPGGGGEAL
jgi:hypothetical protein